MTKSKYVMLGENLPYNFVCDECGYARKMGEIFWMNMKTDQYLCPKCKEKESMKTDKKKEEKCIASYAGGQSMRNILWRFVKCQCPKCKDIDLDYAKSRGYDYTEAWKQYQEKKEDETEDEKDKDIECRTSGDVVCNECGFHHSLNFTIFVKNDEGIEIEIPKCLKCGHQLLQVLEDED